MLTAKDVQNLLHVDRSTVYRMAEAGQLPAMRVGRQWRFPTDEIEAWLKNRAHTPARTPAAHTPAPTSFPTANQSLASLFSVECVQLIQDTFADLLNVMIVVTDMNGQPVTNVSKPCGPFQAIRQLPNALEKCIADWAHFGEILEIEPQLIRSHLGLLGTRGLIRVGHELKGMVIIGGIAPKQWPPSPEKLSAIADDFGVKADTFDAYINDVSFLAEDEIAMVLKMAQRFADILAHIITHHQQTDAKLATIATIINQ